MFRRSGFRVVWGVSGCGRCPLSRSRVFGNSGGMIFLRGLRMGSGFSFGPMSCDRWRVSCGRPRVSCFVCVLTRSGALRGRFFCQFLLFNKGHQTKSHGTGGDGCGGDHANCLDELFSGGAWFASCGRLFGWSFCGHKLAKASFQAISSQQNYRSKTSARRPGQNALEAQRPADLRDREPGRVSA